MKIKEESTLYGRKIELFTHPSDESWGYAEPQEDSFAVIHPRNEADGALYPLYVVFHSAGHELFSTLGCMVNRGDHDIYHTPSDCYALVLDCKAHHKNDWWWGGRDAVSHCYGHPEREGIAKQPVEKRCLDTIFWTMEKYPIDENLVYAVGNSMGGSGALGIGLCRGDIFAAIKANVPAGVRHAADRCCLDTEVPEGFSIPDPPVVVDYSAQNDGWSQGHEVLYRAAREKKLALIGFFGPFGHENDDSKIEAVNDLVHSFDIRTVKKNEAYPVFTDASTDDAIPWPDGLDRQDAGQVNAFFRWKVECDAPDRFEITLRLLSPGEWKTRVILPETAEADLCVRRLQNFRVAPGEEFICEYGGESRVCRADGAGLPEIGRVTVTTAPQKLVLKKPEKR